jgi:hypothetical protein
MVRLQDGCLQLQRCSLVLSPRCLAAAGGAITEQAEASNVELSEEHAAALLALLEQWPDALPAGRRVISQRGVVYFLTEKRLC